MTFNKLDEVEKGYTLYPYASKTENGWTEGLIPITFLNDHFGHLQTAEEMKNATESEGLKLYFDWLKQKGILN